MYSGSNTMVLVSRHFNENYSDITYFLSEIDLKKYVIFVRDIDRASLHCLFFSCIGERATSLPVYDC